MSYSINMPPKEQVALLRRMILIRKAEERLARDFKAGELPGPVHLYIGQEAVATGICAHLTERDWITSTHRGHGHFLAKGGDPYAMFAEIYGRSDGVCGGMGGSMHVADLSKGVLGANGIVGGGLGLATGAALAAQLEGKGNVAVAFFGDGASAQGVLSEALNLASLWKLPLILLCESNGYSEFSPTSTVIAGDLSRRGDSYDVPSSRVDGNDLVAVWQTAAEAVGRARSGAGPTLIVAETYRFHGHVEGEAAFLKSNYRSDEEVDDRRAFDPIERFRKDILDRKAASPKSLTAMEEEIGAMLDKVADEAREAPWPTPEDLNRLEVR